MTRIILPLIATLLATSAASAQTTRRLSAVKANEYALVYTLPVTELKVTIAAEKTVRTPGEFARYSKKYLGSTGILEPSTSWRIAEAVVTPVAVADTDEQYAVTLKGGNATFMMVSDEGFPVSVGDPDYDGVTDTPALPKAVAPEPTILETPEAQRAVTPEMIQSRSSAKRAELAAQKIYELRTNRSEIISGQADGMPSDGAAMKLALDRLDKQEAALTAMFNGTVQTSVEVRTYTVAIPADPEAAGRIAVARLSQTAGLTGADDLSGAPVYVTVTPVTRGSLPLDDKGEPRPFPKGGVAYRIPGSADVTVSYDGATIADTRIDVAQYGPVYGVDPALFTSKKAPAYAHFNPLTGALVEIGTLAE